MATNKNFQLYCNRVRNESVSRLATAWRTIVFTGLMLAGASMALAEPFVPKDDAQVLERLPYVPGGPAMRELRARRNALAHNPRDIAMVVQPNRKFAAPANL